jgi:hypothetical protein
VIIGSGGNIGVLAGPDGKLLVDGGLAGSKSKIQAELMKLGGGPVKHLVNTPLALRPHRRQPVAPRRCGRHDRRHENTVKHLTHETRVEPWKLHVSAGGEGRGADGARAEGPRDQDQRHDRRTRYYGAPGHTDGDLSRLFS